VREGEVQEGGVVWGEGGGGGRVERGEGCVGGRENCGGQEGDKTGMFSCLNNHGII